MKKAVVLLSGGLDSAVTAFVAKADIGKKGELYPLTIVYGQRHIKETVRAQMLCQVLGAPYKELEIPISSIVETALTGQQEVPTNILGAGIPSTWVPQRNSIFLACAFAYAETVDADFVYAGYNVVDYSGYPDCRPEFVDAIGRALNLASKRYIESGKGFGIIAPIIKKSKVDIIKLGLSLDVPFDLTWSCYNGREKACGVCDSCRIRLKAFDEIGIRDPIDYEMEV